MTKCAGAALLFAALVAGQGGGKETFCDKQGVAACYWGFADRFGKIPLLGRNENKTSYLTNLCTSTPSDFPDPNFCKQYRYGRCTEAEIKEFARMERGYAALRGEITSAQNCESVTQLRECMDLNLMQTCSVNLEMQSGTLGDQVLEQNRAALNLKICVDTAVQKCFAKKKHAAISRLQKIADAIVDLCWLPQMQNAAYATKAATAVITASLLSLVVRNFL